MKLYNNKTRTVIDTEIADIEFKSGKIIITPEPIKLSGLRYSYESLSKLKEEWEDYKPAEPYIKDEKIRKAVKAWAEALNVDAIRFERFSQGFSYGDDDVYSSINFDGCVFDLADGKEYTIPELCGEEEE